jgi:hypothetical protein
VTGSRLTARLAAEKLLSVLAGEQEREARQIRAQRGHAIAVIINEPSQRRGQRLAAADQPVARKREQLGQLCRLASLRRTSDAAMRRLLDRAPTPDTKPSTRRGNPEPGLTTPPSRYASGTKQNTARVASTARFRRTPGRIFTGRGIRDAPERAWPSICKIPMDDSASDTARSRHGSIRVDVLHTRLQFDRGVWFHELVATNPQRPAGRTGQECRVPPSIGTG